MGFKGFTLNTPPEEEAHILAEDDAAIYQSIFGEDGVFAIGDRMKATVINNNQVRVGNGVLCVGGHIGRTVYGDYSDMTIENGEISKNRNDIITAIFSTTGEKGIDKFKIEVKKGTPGDVAEDPEITKENLYEGGKLRELPLWRVKLEGINIIGVEQMFKIIPKIPDLEEMIESVNGKLQDTGWVDVKMGNGIVTDTQAPQVRRVGKLVYLRGVVRNNTSWSTHDSFLTIPNNFRPAYTHRCIQTSYGSFRYRLEVLADGQCKALAITNDTEGNATIEKGKWFQVDTCWYVD